MRRPLVRYRLAFLFGSLLGAYSLLSGSAAQAQGTPLGGSPTPSLPEPADPHLPSLVLVGDSTVRNGQADGVNGQWGWGEPLAALFDVSRINVVNRALGGRSSRTYITQGLWGQTLALLKPGDVLLIQFGHNDSSAVNDTSRARGSLKGVGEETEEIVNLLTHQPEVVHTFGWYLRQYVADAKAKGVTPIICSPVPRKIWNGGRIARASEDYGQWAAAVARDEGVPFIDLNELIARRYEELGPAVVEALFADEHTHTTRAGAELAARCVVQGLRSLPDCGPCRYLSPRADAASALEADPLLPHLERRGRATQLLVNGRPHLMLAGELRNSSSSSLEYLRPVWPKLAQMHLNTVLAAVSWEQLEPAPGRFDFSLLDGLIQEARRHDQHLVLLWFGSWKNGTSRYAADWVKTDATTYTRVRNREGRSLEILSPLCEATREADARAFAALMRHVREIDGDTRTVLMIQVQNEVGVLGDSRDRSPAAEAAFAAPVPGELLDALRRRGAALLPELRQVWDAAGGRESGTWQEVFGRGSAADEIFMAWTYARYVERVAAAGKAEYALPMFVNAWLVQPGDQRPGDYPSGGPLAHLADVWRAGAPDIDVLAPDAYLADFPGVLDRFSRSGNPVFVPESRAGETGAANAFRAFGAHGAIGYSPFAIEEREDDPEHGPISRAYDVLARMAPLILEHQARGSIAGFWLTKDRPSESVRLGDFLLEASLRQTRRAPGVLPDLAYGLAIAVAPDEYFVAGTDIQVTFSPKTDGPPVAGILLAEEGTFSDSRWVPGRRLNGDEVQLRYDLSEAARVGQSGAGLRFPAGGPTIQHVKLYRY